MSKIEVKDIPTLKYGTQLIVSGRDEFGVMNSSHASVQDNCIIVDDPWDRYRHVISFEHISKGFGGLLSCVVLEDFENSERDNDQVRIIELKEQIKDTRNTIRKNHRLLLKLKEELSILKQKYK